jgi:hypothetical protein
MIVTWPEVAFVLIVIWGAVLTRQLRRVDQSLSVVAREVGALKQQQADQALIRPDPPARGPRPV